MERWVPATDFIEADVIRWTESVFDRARGKKKARRIGEQSITAEVLHCTDDGWVRLLVRACAVIRDEGVGKRVAALKPGAEIKRARTTILRGAPERLPWSDERARAAVLGALPTSKFYLT